MTERPQLSAAPLSENAPSEPEESGEDSAAVRDTSSISAKVDAISLPEDEDMIGSIVDGKYELLDRLGEGGMGHVYRARHVMMGKEFAVKLIHAELAQVNEIARRFQREARSSSLLKHPNCISVSDFGSFDHGNGRRLYLVMDILEGEDLDYKLHREKKLPPALAVDIISQVLKGLGHAHEQGVIHRDLKPENIFLVPENKDEFLVKILDFGIAKMADSQSDADKLTKTGVVFGTPKYLAPEQALGDPLDYRADLYSVGVILFEMLTGEPPFTGKTAMDIMSAHLTAAPPRLGSYGNYPKGLQRIIQKAMAKKPSHRFATAEQFLKSLEDIDYRDNSAPTIVTGRILRIPFVTQARNSFSTAFIRSFFYSKRRMAASLFLLAMVIVGAGYLLTTANKPVVLRDRVQQPTTVKEAISSFSPKAPTDTNVDELLAAAREALDRDDYRKAEIASKKALFRAPNHPPSKVMLANVLFESGRKVDAMYTYQQAIYMDPAMGKDDRMRANLMKGLQWDNIRKKSAKLLALYGTETDLEKLTELASSALTAGDVRRSVRTSLEKLNKADNVDWLSSLQADFRELKTCKERNNILGNMVQTQNPAFIPFLEKFELKGKRKNQKNLPNYCIQATLKYVIKTLTAAMKPATNEQTKESATTESKKTTTEERITAKATPELKEPSPDLQKQKTRSKEQPQR